jgi:hypothetical protein
MKLKEREEKGGKLQRKKEQETKERMKDWEKMSFKIFTFSNELLILSVHTTISNLCTLLIQYG